MLNNHSLPCLPSFFILFWVATSLLWQHFVHFCLVDVLLSMLLYACCIFDKQVVWKITYHRSNQIKHILTTAQIWNHPWTSRKHPPTPVNPCPSVSFFALPSAARAPRRYRRGCAEWRGPYGPPQQRSGRPDLLELTMISSKCHRFMMS